ncbi:MAG: hypothetical protein BGO49_12320 [Planctomycetales bacterium 71-10]|nr:MAG: hypothetical protein BGO49_12320 [Planctomycetales bacterium 71-10]
MAEMRRDEHPSPALLAAFARGESDGLDTEAVERHLDSCESCRSAVEAASGDDPLVELLRAAGRNIEDGGAPPAIPSGYALEDVIGRGGMGVVHRARQVGLGRVVALKRIAAGVDATPAERSRFRAEAEAAASLRHPNIVPIHDVGELDGVPYYAMELLDGGTLADRLAGGPLPPREAATLVEALARAIEHAHRRGVVHRDLKPRNVLFDAEGTPKVADFGLAKRLDAGTLTRTGALMGTPLYMAPEQATAGPGVPVGPAADVYALGAILYECLAGRPPFPGDSPAEVLDLIRSSEPTRPGRLRPGLPRDLETIALKCLEKSPARRYASAAGLADDLGRFLRGEPILARPAGRAARLAKWARRRPSQAALAGLAILAAAGAVAGLLVHDARLREALGRAETSADEARRQRAAADSNYRDAREALRRLTGAFNDPKFRGLPRLGELRRVQLEAALGFYDLVLARSDADAPVVRRDTAEAAVEAANLQIVLGRPADAEAKLLRALRLYDALAREDPADAPAARGRMVVHLKLGVMLMELDPARSARELEAALALAEARPDSESWQGRHDVAWCLHNLASLHMLSARHAQVEPLLARASAIYDDLMRERPGDLALEASAAETLINLADCRAAAGRPDEAEADFARAAGFLERALAAQPDVPSHAADLCDLAVNRGNLLRNGGKPERAVEQLSEGLRRIAPLVADDPASSRLRQTLQNLHGARAQSFEALGRYADAMPDWDAVVEAQGDRPGRLGLRFLGLLCAARGGQAARVRDEAAAILDHPDEPLKAADRYNVACALALATAAPGGDLDGPSRAAMLDRAAAELARALAEDPALREAARGDSDLAALAGRDDFRKLVDGP